MKKLLTGLALSDLVLLAHAGNKEDIANAMKAGQWQDAQARLEQVLTQHPENAQAHYWMAETHYRLGQYPQAKAQLDEALRLDPEHKFTNNPKALAALQNRLKSVGGPSSPAPQAQAGQGPALPQAQAQFDAGDFTASLQTLAALRVPVDAYFDGVMVNAEALDVRLNRLGTLKSLHVAMNRVADLSRLAS